MNISGIRPKPGFYESWQLGQEKEVGKKVNLYQHNFKNIIFTLKQRFWQFFL